MTDYYQLPIHFNKEKLFTQMRIKKNLWNYSAYEEAYAALTEEIPTLSEVKALYRLVPNTIGAQMHRDLEGLSHLVCCMVTLGPKISERCTAYFMEKDYLKGLMIDSLADQILFELSNDFYTIIRQDICDQQGFGITMRYAPDDRIIPIQFQKDILDLTDGYHKMNVDITEGFMYNPVKTLGYVYGADKGICTATLDHDCSICTNLSCQFRKTAYAGVDITGS